MVMPAGKDGTSGAIEQAPGGGRTCSSEYSAHLRLTTASAHSPLLAPGNAERASAELRAALALWRGPALAEFAFEPFGQAEIGRLDDLRLSAIEERIEADLALGRHSDLIGELEALIAENPPRERLR